MAPVHGVMMLQWFLTFRVILQPTHVLSLPLSPSCPNVQEPAQDVSKSHKHKLAPEKPAQDTGHVAGQPERRGHTGTGKPTMPRPPLMQSEDEAMFLEQVR